MSDQDNSLFGDAGPASGNAVKPSPTASASPTDPGSLGVLVGEGRKYQSTEALAQAYIKADEFIETLKSENSKLRSQVEQATTIDEALKRLQQSRPTGEDHARTQTPGITADAVAEIVKKTVTGLETERTRVANRLRAEAAMKESFGDKAKEVFDKASDSPEKRAALIQLAEVSPDQFIQLFKPASAASPGMQSSSVSSAAMGNQTAAPQGDPGVKAYWDNLRKTKPAEYYSAAAQLKMNQAAQADPDRFFGRRK